MYGGCDGGSRNENIYIQDDTGAARRGILLRNLRSVLKLVVWSDAFDLQHTS